MKAMVLAAGFGTRLRPVTNKIPKALLPITGVPLLEIVLKKLQQHGFTQVAVNAHYRAEQIKDVLGELSKKTDMQLYFSYEPEILNTGGGIKKMLDFFPKDEPVLVHNVDILSDIHYGDLVRKHIECNAAGTLVTNKRHTDRPLAFNAQGDFIGRLTNFSENDPLIGFCGIQVIQPSLFRAIKEDIFYSIDVYENAVKKGLVLKEYDITGFYWRDVGTIRDLQDAEDDIRRGIFLI